MKLSLIGTIGALCFSALTIKYQWQDASMFLLALACVFGILNCVGYLQERYRTIKEEEDKATWVKERQMIWRRIKRRVKISKRRNGMA